MRQTIRPFERIAIFIDGENFRYAAYNGFGCEVDLERFINFFANIKHNAILLRAYYYTGEWTPDARRYFIKQRYKDLSPEEQAVKEKELEEEAKKLHNFHRAISRLGYMVITKPIKVFAGGKIKADLDLELAIDMLTLADRCDRQILVSGDGDFVPLVRAVGARGVRIEVVSSLETQTPDGRPFPARAADELVDAADEFTELKDILKYIKKER